jgi:hypothetical protein
MKTVRVFAHAKHKAKSGDRLEYQGGGVHVKQADGSLRREGPPKSSKKDRLRARRAMAALDSQSVTYLVKS